MNLSNARYHIEKALEACGWDIRLDDAEDVEAYDFLVQEILDEMVYYMEDFRQI